MSKNTFQKNLLISFAVAGLSFSTLPMELHVAYAQSLPGEKSAPSSVPNFFDAPMATDFNFEDEEDFGFEESEEELKETARQEAFEAAVQSTLPLRPEEIRTLLEHYDRTQESVELPVYPSPRPEIVVETVPLDPGTRPTEISVAYGHVTTLNILDISGAPWPIEDISWAGNFEIMDTGGDGSHIVRISPQSEFARGNMSIRLLTLQTPVIMTLETSREKVHYRFDAVIPKYGPLAEAPLIESGLSIVAGDKDTASVLRGIVPDNAKKLNVSGVDGRTTAYTRDNLTYIRTPLTLLSPSWSSSVASADGMRVYTIQNAPILLLSDKGKMVRARLFDREDIFDE